MPSSGLGAYQVKIHQIIFGGLFFVVALSAVRGLAAGNVTNVKMLGALSVVAAAVFALDRHYWLNISVSRWCVSKWKCLLARHVVATRH